MCVCKSVSVCDYFSICAVCILNLNLSQEPKNSPKNKLILYEKKCMREKGTERDRRIDRYTGRKNEGVVYRFILKLEGKGYRFHQKTSFLKILVIGF